MPNQRGFTLIELLVVMLLTSLLFIGGGLALRTYWLSQSLRRARAEVVTHMRNAQQRAMAESHPIVYGVRFRPGTDDWGIVQYDPRKPADRCSGAERLTFDGGVRVKVDPADGFTGGGAARADCAALWPDQLFVFFFPRGSATPGRITIESPTLARESIVSVAGVTGRVTGR